VSVPQNVTRWKGAVITTLARLTYPIGPNLVLAIIWKESSGDPAAWNPEPRYRWLWDLKHNRPFRQLTAAEAESEEPPGDFACFAGDRDQEWWAQQASWGLMQVMGAAARERGLTENYIGALLNDPFLGIEYGIRHLWHYAFQLGNRQTVDALNRYNAGGNTPRGAYAADVLSKKKIIESNATT